MRKIILASVAVIALIAGLGPVKAEEPGEQQLLSQRGTLQGNQIGSSSYGSSPLTSSEFFVSERYGPVGYVPIVGPAVGGVLFGTVN
ncbi:MAG TPA: hypothetical protein PL193_12465 [Xanthobacteraceae bacterium]|nr:hypothetical protein [Xanthobacteraceae bacterium]